MLYGAIAAVVIIAVVLALVLTRGGSSSTPRTIPWSQLGALQTGRQLEVA